MMDKLQIFHHINEEQLGSLPQLISPDLLEQLPEFIC